MLEISKVDYVADADNQVTILPQKLICAFMPQSQTIMRNAKYGTRLKSNMPILNSAIPA